MEKPDVEKIRQLLENKQAGNILLGMQLIQTFGLEKEFLTEISEMYDHFQNKIHKLMHH